MKIAVYSPNWVGDAALALPFIHKIKSKYPTAKIFVICKEWVSSIYVNNPNVDKLIIIPKEKTGGIFNTLRMGFSLIKEDFEIFYTLTDSLRSSIIMWLSKSKKRVGYNTQGRGIFLTDKIVLPKEKIHRSLKYLRLIGEEQFNKDEKLIFIDNDELIWARKEIDEIGVKSPVALFPFSISSSRTFPEKKILEWVKDSDENYLIFGSSDDRQKASIIANNNDMKITSICGNYSLRKSIILMSLCKYAIAADSGLGHISSIVGVPTISFFGAKRSSVTGPIGDNCIIIDKSHRCKPCKKNTCCLISISSDDVNSSIKSLSLDM